MRTCNSCLSHESKSPFPKRGNECKQCVAVYMKAYREANKVRIASLKKEWKIKNSEHVKQKDKIYSETYPERRQAARLKWLTENPEKNKKVKAEWSIINKDKTYVSRRKWAKNNPAAMQKIWAKRRASRLSRTPKWLDSEDSWLIQEIYDFAVLRTKTHGFKWHVDHIIPLQGKLVSGLHVPTNLQVIPAIANVRKSNRYEVA